MRPIQTLLIAVIGLSSLGSAHAEGGKGIYLGGNITRTTLTFDDTIPDTNPTTLGFVLGSELNKNLAVEVRLGASIQGSSTSGLEFKVDNYSSVLVKGILPLSETSSLYGLLGYTRGEVSFSSPLGSASDSDSDISFGLGASFSVSPTTSLGIEWARLFKGDGYKVEGLSVGFNVKF